MEYCRASDSGSASEPKRLYDFCERNARLFGSSQCFIQRQADHSYRSWTWSLLFQEVLKTAGFLQHQSVVPQSRVLNISSNSLEWILIELACSSLNAIHVPVDPRLPEQSVLGILRDIQPVLLITENCEHVEANSHFEACSSCQQLRSYIDQLRDYDRTGSAVNREACRVVSPFHDQDVANILFTSGTTSTPKGVMLSHRNLVTNAMAKLDAMPQFSSDHRLNILPFSHAYAKTCELATWMISASCLEIASSSRELVNSFATAKPTLFNGVPLLFNRIYDVWQNEGGNAEALHGITGGRIRQLASGGAPIREDLRVAFERSGLPIYQGYGLTETGPVVCSNRSGACTGGTDRCLVGVGPAVKGVELKIDESRHLWVRGDGVMLGYWNAPEATKGRIKNGWLDTGDIAELDEFGNLKILGRSDDTIVLENGYKIDPLGIEQMICHIPGVRDCALVTVAQCGYAVIILCEENQAASGKTVIENKLLDLLSKHLSVLPRRVVLSTEDWSESNGFRNFKGTKNRSKIASLVER